MFIVKIFLFNIKTKNSNFEGKRNLRQLNNVLCSLVYTMLNKNILIHKKIVTPRFENKKKRESVFSHYMQQKLIPLCQNFIVSVLSVCKPGKRQYNILAVNNIVSPDRHHPDTLTAIMIQTPSHSNRFDTHIDVDFLFILIKIFIKIKFFLF